MLPLSFVPPAQAGRGCLLLLFTAGPPHCPASSQPGLSAALPIPTTRFLLLKYSWWFLYAHLDLTDVDVKVYLTSKLGLVCGTGD